MAEEKRRVRFAEKFSTWTITLAAIGAAIVLLDPEFTLTIADGITFKIGGRAFSDEIRGGVVTIAIIGTISGLVRFWLPGSETPPQAPAPPGTSTTITTKEIT